MKKIILTICVVIFNIIYALGAGGLDAIFYRIIALDGAPLFILLLIQLQMT